MRQLLSAAALVFFDIPIWAFGWFLAAIIWATPALAHDHWSNGDKIPDWIKTACCGPADAHHLRPEQVHNMGDWYEVDGYHGKIPHQVALPSQDGDYWIFYAEGGGALYGGANSSQSGVYCFFVPMVF